MDYSSLIMQFAWIVVLALYAFGFIFLTRKFYHYMVDKRRLRKKVAIYYNRKFIHIFAGGVVVLVVPFVFDNPFFPVLAGILLAIIMFVFHRSKHLLYWFQQKKDFNDVTFCFMWAIAIFVLWTVFQGEYGEGAKWIAVMPPAFIAFGDGITGIVRNFGFKERSKHPIGNIYMAGVCIIIGFFFGSWSGVPGLGAWGVIAAVIASIFERYEFGPLDDNVLITISSTLVLALGGFLGPVIVL